MNRKRRHADLFQQMPRGIQIWADVRRRLPEAWLATDDDDLDWPAWYREHLVRTHEVLTISSPVVLADLKKKLAAIDPA
jgi:hypothetical protein